MVTQIAQGWRLALTSKLFAVLLPLCLSLPSVAKSQNITCDGKSSTQTDVLVSDLVQMATWVGEPTSAMDKLIENMGPQLLAYFTRSPWPSIHERAQLGRVPIMMYHDILPQKEVFFDVTPKEFEEHLRLIEKSGLTPISLNQLIAHLSIGLPLPEKPILLSFDDGYGGHYEFVYQLLKKYGYPAVFSIYTSNIGQDTGRTHVTWDQLRQIAADPLITIAAHSVTHPPDLRALSEDKIQMEVMESKRLLEANLGIPIHYFTYPAGKYDDRVVKAVREAGYLAAITMDDGNEGFAGQSEDLLAIKRFGQSRLEDIISQAWGGPKLPTWNREVDFSSSIQRTETTIDNTPFILISGGKPITIHADSRYQVQEILAGTEAVAAVDGGFFSLKYLDSNVMIGPVLSQKTGEFIPGNNSENRKLARRPLVLISPHAVNFIPFDPTKHNTLSGVKADMPEVTDAFVAAAFLVRDSQPQAAATFNNLYTYEVPRHRAFWGINQDGQPTIGVSKEPIDSVALGKALVQAGFRDAVMLDSGASTSLAYKGESQVGYVPRPVPHVVALVPTQSATASACVLQGNQM